MMNSKFQDIPISIGVGLRHEHYADILASSANIDFIEVHAENFFTDGGAASALLQQVAEIYPVSIHATTLGLGSAVGVPTWHMDRLKQLIEHIPPFLLSDHACFTWSSMKQRPVHAGDLLPIPFNQTSMEVLTENLRLTQERLGHEVMIENLSSYLTPEGSQMREVDFLVQVCEQAGSRLLLDLNNLAVNAINDDSPDVLADIADYINSIPVGMVGEIHLAGCTPALPGELMIDDHSQPVSSIVWAAFRLALRRFGPVPTLIEWDTCLPTWDTLTAEVDKARAIASEEMAAGELV